MDKKTWLLEALRSPMGDPQRVGGEALSHLAAHTALGNQLQHGRLSISDALRLFDDPLMIALLERTLIANSALERLMTGLRSELLNCANPPAELCWPLAQQCHNNEFVWTESPEETSRLKNGVAPEIAACYLSRDLEPSPATLATDNATSRAVAAQYEEQPYPRYLGYHRWETRTARAHLETLFPGLPALQQAVLSESTSVLIAGCGTGRQALSAATRYRGEVVGLDLSANSLRYADVFRVRDGLSNLTLVQGDLLEIGGGEQSFEVIECTGVLHHLENPQAGLRALLSRLRKGGLLRLGLYSRAGRRAVEAARAFLLERGLGAERLVEARQHLLTLGPEHPAFAVTAYLDFYSRSGTRDLLWPAHESCFSLPEIAELLEGEGLIFLGFEEPRAGAFKAYDCLFPSDSHRQRVDFWSVFERQYPSTFRAMYQFWCLKP